MRIFLNNIIIIVCLLAGCGDAGQNTANNNRPDSMDAPATALATRTKTATSMANDSIFTQRLIDTISKLPEVVKQAGYINEQTKGERRLKVWIDAVPHQPEQPFYCLKAGEDNGDALVTHLNFCIDPVTLEVFYYDPISDSTQTLDAWRKSLNK